MTITTGHSTEGGRRRARLGFTLTETIVAMSLTVLVAAAIMSSLVFVGRSSMGIANYSEMNRESRRALEVVARDIRSARDIIGDFDQYGFTINVLRPDGTVEAVTYTYRPFDPARPLVRIAGASEQAIITGLEELEFSYNDLQRNSALGTADVKQIQMKGKIVRQGGVLPHTERVVSARYILRNKRVTN